MLPLWSFGISLEPVWYSGFDTGELVPMTPAVSEMAFSGLPFPCRMFSPKIDRFGAVAQLGERSVRNAKVEGSNPFRSTHL